MADRELLEQLDQAIGSLLAGGKTEDAGPELGSLVEIAAKLRYMPADGFKERLRRGIMTASTTKTPASTPAGFRTITPFLIHSQAPELVDFLKTTFRAQELKRNTAGEAYGFYSEVRIGDTVVMIGGGTAASHGNLPSALHVYVDDCDGAYRRALNAGAATFMGALGEPADRPYGERSAFVQDPFGNLWYIATRLAPNPAAEAMGSVLPYLHPAHARKEIEFLQSAFGAREVSVFEHGGRVMHAQVGLGNAVVELGEPEDRAGIPTNGLFVFVEDVDAAHARALAAGASEVRPPQDEPYGMRSAIVRDPEGYFWWPARRIG